MYWIIKPIDKLAVYSHNRIKTIKDSGVHQNVFYTSSEENVADLVTKVKHIFNLLEQKSLNVELQNFLEKMADKPITLKPIDIKHKFNLHKLQHKTHFMTQAFSSTAGVIGITLIIGGFCIIKNED